MMVNKVIISLLHKVQCHSLILKMNMENSKRKISLIGKSKTCQRVLATMIGIMLSVSAYSGNPFLPGNFADPCMIAYKDTFYLYATTSVDATVWYSTDLKNWKLRTLNWPTSTHLRNMWAPAVVQGKDGRFYAYYSLKSQIYVGVADHPVGPFRNLLPDEAPFIKSREYFPPKIHTIDADCFIDDDGQAYLYWGSGWDFKDGVCAVGKLNDDMCSFKEAPVDITPKGYFEAPHVFKRGGKYYLMYSDGVYKDDTYKVRYAMSDSPLGPFVEGKNSPILVSDTTRRVHGPGHNFTLRYKDEMYIVYHKHEYPLYNGSRQVCIDKMTFDKDGYINPIIPTDRGFALSAKKNAKSKRVLPATVTASSSLNANYLPNNAFDDSMGTLWLAQDSGDAMITINFGKKKRVTVCEPFFAEVRGAYNFQIDYQDEKGEWMVYYVGNNKDVDEWPVTINKDVYTGAMRMNIKNADDNSRIGLWEWKIYAD